MANFMQYLNISTQLVPPSTIGNTSKQVLLFGQRDTGGTLYLATNGFNQPNYYIPFLLPSFANGTAALAYLGNYGIKYEIGYNFTLNLPEPTGVTQSNGYTYLTWTTIPYGFSSLIGFDLSGTVTQTSISVSGPAQSAAIISGVATLIVSGTHAFTITDGALVLTGVNNVQYPDPIASDPIALMVWDFYQSALSANSSANGVPAAYISIMSDRDSSITPSVTPIALAAPNSVVISGSTAILNYTYTNPLSSLTNFGYLPTTAFGSTTVTQATSGATGTYGGFTISPTSTGGTVSITVTATAGTFVNGDTISVVLDNTINGFNFLNNIDLYGAVQQYPINSLTNITTTYADFYAGVAMLNQANQVLNNHYLTYGIAGNITSLPSNAGNLPVANDQYKILVTYPYVAQFGNIPYDNVAGTVASGRVASAAAYMLANGDAPYPPLMGATINHIPVSSIASTTSYSNSQNGTGNIAVTQGWLPLAPNSNNVVQFLESNTTLTTIPNTNVQDIEFRYTHVWDCVRYLKFQVAQLYKNISVLPNNQGSALISPAFLRQFRSGIVSILYTAQNLGIVQNVALYENLVTVTQDITVPTQVDATVPSQIIPQLNGANVDITVFSSLYQFTSNAA